MTKKTLFFLGLAGMATSAFGQITIYIDFNTSAGSVTGTGDTWNNIEAPVDGTALLSSTGASSGLSISDYTLDTNAGQGYLVWGAGANYASVSDSGTDRNINLAGTGSASWVPANAVDDYFFGGGVNGVGMEFSGFLANQTDITIELFASNTGTKTAMYFVQGVTVDGVSTADADPAVDFFETDANTSTVLTWTNVQADGLGRIFVEADARDTSLDGARFNAMRITAVPEPSTYVLVAGMLTLGLVFVRRRGLR